MAHTYQETEYLYSSARVRFMENTLAGKERLVQLSEAPDADAVLAALPEFGFALLRTEDGRIDREQTLLQALRHAYDELSGMCPSTLTDFLRYPYDAHNVKSILKCRARGISPESMLLDLGTVNTEVLLHAMAEQDYAALPSHMAAAIPVASEEFAKTKNPQVIDLILDRAAYADMTALAEASDLPYLKGLALTKVDLINLISCVRILRMALSEAAVPLLQSAYLEGGSLALSDLCAHLEAGDEAALWEWVSHTAYASLTQRTGAPFSQLEKLADDLWMEKAREAKYISFGAPILLGYLIAMEYQVKNIRIILAGKDAGHTPESIRERLRASYV